MAAAAPARRIRQLLALSAAVVVLGAAKCFGDDDITGTGESAAGVYSLTSITQGSSSCAMGASGCTIEGTGDNVIVVKSGTLTVLETGHAFTVDASGTENGVDQNFDPVVGTWSQTASTVSFTVPGVPGAMAGVLQNGILTFTVPGQLFNSTQGSIAVTFTKQD